MHTPTHAHTHACMHSRMHNSAACDADQRHATACGPTLQFGTPYARMHAHTHVQAGMHARACTCTGAAGAAVAARSGQGMAATRATSGTRVPFRPAGGTAGAPQVHVCTRLPARLRTHTHIRTHAEAECGESAAAVSAVGERTEGALKPCPASPAACRYRHTPKDHARAKVYRLGSAAGAYHHANGHSTAVLCRWSAPMGRPNAADSKTGRGMTAQGRIITGSDSVVRSIHCDEPKEQQQHHHAGGGSTRASSGHHPFRACASGCGGAPACFWFWLLSGAYLSLKGRVS